jgi:hypothetical protein
MVKATKFDICCRELNSLSIGATGERMGHLITRWGPNAFEADTLGFKKSVTMDQMAMSLAAEMAGMEWLDPAVVVFPQTWKL